MTEPAPSWLRAILGVRLQAKVLGANLAILLFAVVVMQAPLRTAPMPGKAIAVVLLALSLGALVNYTLIRLAFRPLTDLENVARRVTEGNVSARVAPSLVADPDLAHLASTMNEMLDNLEAGRSRLRKLGADVASAQERERAQLARELNDSVAQSLVAASFHVAAAAGEIGMGPGSEFLDQARTLMRSAVEEIRTLSRSLHPRVADDIGLPAALEALIDGTRQRALIDARLTTDISGAAIPPALGTTLYRIAQEALRDVERHAGATSVTLSLSSRSGVIELEVADDGPGAVETAEMDPSPVLARMRQRLSLAGGELHIHKAPDCGTRVVATVRLDTEAA